MEKKVLLFSGGFDSLLQEFLIKPDVLLYVDMKTKYSQRELEHLQTLPDTYKSRLVIKELPLGEYERDNSYLPYRNLLLGAIAMQYGQYVYFGFNSTDFAPDKDKKFMRLINQMFQHLNKNCLADMNWSTENFGFYAPYQDKTKAEMVKMCINKGMNIKLIQTSRSCYSGESVIGCGKCKVCFNRAVALILNGVYLPELFDEPITIRDFEETLKIIKNDGHSKKHISEVTQALSIFKKEK